MVSLADQFQKKPLFRKVNTRTHGVAHYTGGDYRHDRNKKGEVFSEETRGTMHGHEQRGLDYTPLFKFMLSRVGHKWDEIYSEVSVGCANDFFAHRCKVKLVCK